MAMQLSEVGEGVLEWERPALKDQPSLPDRISCIRLQSPTKDFSSLCSKIVGGDMISPIVGPAAFLGKYNESGIPLSPKWHLAVSLVPLEAVVAVLVPVHIVVLGGG